MRWPTCSIICNCPSTSVRIGHWQLLVDRRALFAQRLQPGLAPAAQHHAKLVQQPAQRVHCGRAHAHPVRARSVQCQHGLLLHTLLRHATDVALLRCNPDRPRVGRIVLVAAHERSHLRSRQQLDLVTLGGKYPCPVVRAAASLHHDAHRLELREVLGQPGTRQLLAANLARLSVNPVQLHHVLCNVQTISRTIHSGPPVSEVHSDLHFGTRCRATRGPTHPADPLSPCSAAFVGSSPVTAPVLRVGGVHAISVGNWICRDGGQPAAQRRRPA
jgi:hypothetical protein